MAECSKCDGEGEFHYPNTGTWLAQAFRVMNQPMVVGHGFTYGVCDKCWGSGDSDAPGPNLWEAYKKENNIK